jgi:DNA-binding NarL/FixJ family response regulator
MDIVYNQNPSPPSQMKPLGRRESEAVRLLHKGLTDREIAALMFVKEKTVSTVIHNAMWKVGARTRAALAVAVERNEVVLDGYPIRPARRGNF